MVAVIHEAVIHENENAVEPTNGWHGRSLTPPSATL